MACHCRDVVSHESQRCSETCAIGSPAAAAAAAMPPSVPPIPVLPLPCRRCLLRGKGNKPVLLPHIIRDELYAVCEECNNPQ